jgi:hypothetical protein
MQSFCPFADADNSSDETGEIVAELIVEMRALLGVSYESMCLQIHCNEELRIFLKSYLAHRCNWLGTPSHNGSLSELDRCVASLAHRVLVCTERQHSEEMISRCLLFEAQSLLSLSALLGDTNNDLATEIVRAAAAAHQSVFTTDVSQSLVKEAEASSLRLAQECVSLCSLKPSQIVSRNKTDVAVVVSLGSKKLTLAEKAKAAATAAAASQKKQSSVAALAHQSNVIEIELVVAAANEACHFAQAWSCFLAALPPHVMGPHGLGFANLRNGTTGAEVCVGKAGEQLLLSLRRVYEQALPALAAAKAAWLRLSPVGTNDSSLADRIDFLLVLAASRLVKAFRRVLLVSADKSALAAQSDAAASSCDGPTWPVLLEKLLSSPCTNQTGSLPPGTVVESAGGDWLTGALVSDASRVFGKDVAESVRALCSDAEQREYFVEAVTHPPGLPFLLPSRTPKAPSSSSSSSASSASFSAAAPSPGGAAAFAREKESIDSVLCIFPDMGESFAGMCLESFDWNVERAIDALLADNLPPALRKFDRTLKHAWVGKGGPRGGNEVGTLGASAQKTYALPPEDEEFKRAQRERLLAEERRREEDFKIMSAEYQDDYDDQFDDARAEIETPEGAEGAGAASKSRRAAENQKSLAQRINWEVQMNTTKRYNQLVREQEQEDAYWEQMRNTNHDRFARDEAEDEGAATVSSSASASTASRKAPPNHPPQQQPHQHHNQGQGQGQGKGQGRWGEGGRGRPAGESAGPGRQGAPPFRTKTYDKHHAKDKSLRKMGGGGGQS